VWLQHVSSLSLRSSHKRASPAGGGAPWCSPPGKRIGKLAIQYQTHLPRGGAARFWHAYAVWEKPGGNAIPTRTCPAVVQPSASSCSPSLPPKPRSLDRGRSCGGESGFSIEQARFGQLAESAPTVKQQGAAERLLTVPSLQGSPHFGKLCICTTCDPTRDTQPSANATCAHVSKGLACMTWGTERGGITVCWLGLCCRQARRAEGHVT